MAMTHIFPTWYKGMTIPMGRKILREVEKIINENPLGPAKIKRFYVEKANGKLRPIGCPSPA